MLIYLEDAIKMPLIIYSIFEFLYREAAG